MSGGIGVDLIDENPFARTGLMSDVEIIKRLSWVSRANYFFRDINTCKLINNMAIPSEPLK